MRTKTKYILLAIMVFFQFSCNDWLELLPPSGLIREEFWQVKEDVEAVLMSAYEAFAGMDRELFLHGELRADLITGDNNQSNDERDIMQSNIYPDNPYCDWAGFYSVINYCNEVIKNGPLVKEIDNTFTDYQLNTLLAEAYFLRSLSYFYLVRIYKDVPLALEPFETDAANFFIPKSSEEEVLNQIVEDLVTNRPFAPSGGFPTIAENKGRASKAAYDALLADIELWRFNYNEVINYVERIEITEEFELLPSDRWFENYYPGNSLESIFEFQFDAALDQRNSTSGLTSRFNNLYDPSQKAIEMFSFDYGYSEIKRGLDNSIAKFGEDNYGIWKYVGQANNGITQRSGTAQGSANWIVYRLADVLLMKAEALSQLGRYNEAQEIIDVIRERAESGLKAIANTTVAFEDAIMEERALELAFEGKRWFDLLRLGRRNNYARKDKLIEVVVSNIPSTQKRILAAKLTNPLGWYLPVFEDEIERNRNMEQNPYYDY